MRVRTMRNESPANSAPEAAIVPIVVGAADDAVRLAAHMRAAGFLVPAIRPPSVPDGSSRLRATVMATHTPEQIAAFVRAYQDAVLYA